MGLGLGRPTKKTADRGTNAQGLVLERTYAMNLQTVVWGEGVENGASKDFDTKSMFFGANIWRLVL